MTKVVSLSDRAYTVLSFLKKSEESFSDVILRLSKRERKKTLLSHAGKWKGDDIDEIFSRIASEREEGRSREVQF